MDFLTGHKFDVGTVFRSGVRYLSRQEEIKTHEVAARFWAPSPPTEIERRVQDVEDIQYVRVVRLKIDAWLAAGKVSAFYPSAASPSIPSVKLTYTSDTRNAPVHLSAPQQ
jgi:hypothetical protein